MPVFSANLHEARGYNRAARMARGRYYVILQDDQRLPGSGKWLRVGGVGGWRVAGGRAGGTRARAEARTPVCAPRTRVCRPGRSARAALLWFCLAGPA